jgi:hypothetical protein
LRRLGVGGGNGGGDRPLRAQLVVALVAVLILLAVPLYLWRRPSGQQAAAASASAAAHAASAIPTSLQTSTAKIDERVKLGPLQKVKCSASARLSGQKGALCDSLPFFEEQLEKAIVENVDCAPKTGKPGSVNYVLTIDFTNRRLNVFPGASGAWKGPQARRSAECIERALPAPEWDKVQHQYRYYNIAIMASYQPLTSPNAPLFE